MDIKLTTLTCKRCRHTWIPRKAELPIRCAKCKSPYWNKDRINESKGTTNKE